MSRKNTKLKILKAALALAESKGLRNATREEIAKRAGVGDRVVSYHFGTIPQLWEEVVLHACAAPEQHLKIIAQALVLGDPRAKMLDSSIKSLAMNEVAA